MEFVKTPKYRVNSWQQKKLNMGCTLDEVKDLEIHFQKLRESKPMQKYYVVQCTDERRQEYKDRAKQWRDEQKNKQNAKPIDA